MAKPSRCAGCEKYNWETGICKIYGIEIPNDIFVEIKECKDYVLEKEDDFNDDLPIAKGR